MLVGSEDRVGRGQEVDPGRVELEPGLLLDLAPGALGERLAELEVPAGERERACG